MKSFTGLTHLQDISKIALLPDHNSQPAWSDAKKNLVPLFDMSFDQNFTAWGEEFFNLVHEELRQKRSAAPDLLKLVSDECFTKVLKKTTWETIAKLWRSNRKDPGWKGAANSKVRQSSQKANVNLLRRLITLTHSLI